MALKEFKCPNCGGKMEFDSRLQKMRCPYCDSVMEMDDVKDNDPAGENSGAMPNDIPGDDLRWNTQSENNWQSEDMYVYTCQSCGGEIAADPYTAATTCPFCDNPVVMTGQFAGVLKPDWVIPFKMDKKMAKEALKGHLKGKKLLPKVFKDENHIDEIKGIYVPFWLFDTDAEADLEYKATRVRHWSDSKYNYTETSYYSVWRGGHIGFSCIPVDGSTKMADDLMESIEPFDLSQAVPFQTAYLSGYLADKYDVSAKMSEGRANERVINSTRNAFASTVQGYMSVIPGRSSIRLQNGQVHYALYPVWILNTTWKNNRYIFAMNGQTGKFVGDLPTDMGAFWRWFFGLTGIFGAAAFLMMFLFWLI